MAILWVLQIPVSSFPTLSFLFQGPSHGWNSCWISSHCTHFPGEHQEERQGSLRSLYSLPLKIITGNPVLFDFIGQKSATQPPLSWMEDKNTVLLGTPGLQTSAGVSIRKIKGVNGSWDYILLTFYMSQMELSRKLSPNKTLAITTEYLLQNTNVK